MYLLKLNIFVEESVFLLLLALGRGVCVCVRGVYKDYFNPQVRHGYVSGHWHPDQLNLLFWSNVQ